MAVFKKIKEWIKKGGNETPDIDDFGDEGSEGAGDKAETNKSGIVRFEYRYNGSIGGDSFSWEAERVDNGVRLTAEEMVHREYGEMTRETDESFMARLETLYREQKLARWNGFDKFNRHVLDGSGFSLYIKFADGGRLSAHGSNSFPGGYREFKEKLREIFVPEVEKMHDDARAKLIEKGISGKLDFIMATFKQQGSSGSDSYEALISTRGVRMKNFDVTIRSVSGEFIAPGEYRVYRDVPDEAIGFERFDEIMKRHGIIRWINYDKAAKDYNNSEWFQLSLGFDEDYVNAHGTEHPDGYDAFRHDFLSELAAATQRVLRDYPDDCE